MIAYKLFRTKKPERGIKVKNLFKKHRVFVLHLILITLAIWLVPQVALAANMDDSGMKIYKKLAKIGKWAIVVKGAIDVIQSAINGDYQQAKAQFMGYLLCFAILLALPYGLDEVENAFGYQGG